MARRRIFRFLHGILIALGLLMSVALFSSKGGHPPAIILLPVVLVAWVSGHGFLAFTHWALRRRASDSVEESSPERWPFPVLLIFLVSAGSLFVLLNGLGWSLGMNHEEISVRRMAYIGLVVGSVAAVFFGVLFRRPWGRILVACVPAAFFVLIALRIASAFSGPSRVDPSSWVVAAIYLGGSAALSIYLFRSPASIAFFDRSGRSRRTPTASSAPRRPRTSG